MGRPEEYAVLNRLIEPLRMPVYAIPGNHDERRAFKEAFAAHTYLPSDGEFLHYAIEDYPLRLIGLDTTIPGEEGGMMCAERLSWLDARLSEERERPTAIFMHHPPFLTGSKRKSCGASSRRSYATECDGEGAILAVTPYQWTCMALCT